MGSLRTDLINSLNTALTKSAANSNIVVIAANGLPTETDGLDKAHAEARAIGRKFNASMVIWGAKIGNGKFHPRITIVNDIPHLELTGGRALAVQNITDAALPPELVDNPIALTHFLIAYDCHERGDEHLALSHLQVALSARQLPDADLADVHFLSAIVRLSIAEDERGSANQLAQAIDDLTNAITYYNAQGSITKLTKTKNALGLAYLYMPGCNTEANHLRALGFFKAALANVSQDNQPEEFAGILNNIGAACLSVPQEKQKGLDILLKARTLLDKIGTPEERATVHLNLTSAFLESPQGNSLTNFLTALAETECAVAALEGTNRGALLVQTHILKGKVLAAIAHERPQSVSSVEDHFNEASRISREMNSPALWATAQIELGFAYVGWDEDAQDLAGKAITTFELALDHLNRTDSPADWAAAKRGLAIAYSQLANGDAAENFSNALNAIREAQAVQTQDGCPSAWATTQNTLGMIYVHFAKFDQEHPDAWRISCFTNAIAAFKAAMAVTTEENDPFAWAELQHNLGVANLYLANAGQKEALPESINAFEACLRVRTQNIDPFNWARTMLSLGSCYALPVDPIQPRFEQGISAIQAALTVFTKDEHPLAWAQAEFMLGAAYLDSPRDGLVKGATNAINALENAIAVLREHGDPLMAASACVQLAKAYVAMPAGDRAQNINKAIASAREAIAIYTSLSRPLAKARTLAAQAALYELNPGGNHKENLRLASECLDSAVPVFKTFGSKEDLEHATEMQRQIQEGLNQ